MAANQVQSAPKRPRIPRSGTPEAEAFVSALEARVHATERKLKDEFIGLDEVGDFCLKTGLSALTSQIRAENGDDRFFTRKAEPKPKKKAKRVRVSI